MDFTQIYKIFGIFSHSRRVTLQADEELQPETTAHIFIFMFAQLNIVQIKRFNFYFLMWYGFDLNLLGVFTIAVSLLKYVVPNSGHIPIREISHMGNTATISHNVLL